MATPNRMQESKNALTNANKYNNQYRKQLEAIAETNKGRRTEISRLTIDIWPEGAKRIEDAGVEVVSMLKYDID